MEKDLTALVKNDQDFGRTRLEKRAANRELLEDDVVKLREPKK